MHAVEAAARLIRQLARDVISLGVYVLLNDRIIRFVNSFLFERLLAGILLLILLLRRLAGITWAALAFARLLRGSRTWNFDNDLSNRFRSGCGAGNVHQELSDGLVFRSAVGGPVMVIVIADGKDFVVWLLWKCKGRCWSRCGCR